MSILFSQMRVAITVSLQLTLKILFLCWFFVFLKKPIIFLLLRAQLRNSRSISGVMILLSFHNHAIRKSKGDFVFLFNEERRKVFMHALSETVRCIPFSIAATAVDKRELSNSLDTDNPCILALGSCLKQTVNFLEEKGQLGHLTHLIVESRGTPEDQDL